MKYLIIIILLSPLTAQAKVIKPKQNPVIKTYAPSDKAKPIPIKKLHKKIVKKT